MFGYMSLHCDPDLKDSNLIFWHATPAHDGTPAYQVWLQKAQQFRRYRPHKTQTDGLADRWTDSNIPMYLLTSKSGFLDVP